MFGTHNLLRETNAKTAAVCQELFLTVFSTAGSRGPGRGPPGKAAGRQSAWASRHRGGGSGPRISGCVRAWPFGSRISSQPVPGQPCPYDPDRLKAELRTPQATAKGCSEFQLCRWWARPRAKIRTAGPRPRKPVSWVQTRWPARALAGWKPARRQPGARATAGAVRNWRPLWKTGGAKKNLFSACA